MQKKLTPPPLFDLGRKKVVKRGPFGKVSAIIAGMAMLLTGGIVATANADDGTLGGATAPESASVAPIANETAGSLLVDESFKNADFAQANNWIKVGAACLTAGDGACRNDVDSENIQGAGDGKGYLQLTDNSKSQSGAVLYNQAIPSRQGLDITFDEYMYYGDNGHGGFGNMGADGMSFFLTDGAATLSNPGAAGAGLGYASKDDDVSNGRNDKEEGIAQGVLGIGLDMFGNFSKEQRGNSGREVGGQACGAQDGGDSDSVTLRGAGAMNDDDEWMDGYCRLSTFPNAGLATNAATSNADDTNGKKVRIRISPLEEGQEYQTVTVWINDTQVANYTLTYKLPTTIKFGFSASTGGNHQVHLVRGLTAYSVTPVSDINVAKQVDKDKVPGYSDGYTFKSGETVPYKFTVTNGGKETLTEVKVIDPLIQNIQCPDTLNPLDSGESVTCTGSLTLSDAQAAAGSLTNTVTATGKHGDTTVSDTDSTTVKTMPSLGTPSHRKWVEKVEGTNDTYKLNLNVIGGGSSTSTSATKADIVVILDRSGSMAYRMRDNKEPGRNEKSRLAIAKDAIESMSSQLLTDNHDVRMSLVTFSGDKGSWGYDRAYNDADINQSWTDSKATFDNAVGGIVADGGTNWQAGFMKAGDLLDSARDGAEKYVVFLSDGEAGYYYDSDGDTAGSGSKFNQTAYDKAVQAAEVLGLPANHIWSVGVSTASDSTNMNKLATSLSGKYLDGSDEDDLQAALDSIAQTITSTSTYKIQSIQDTLSGWVDPAWTGDLSEHIEVYHNDEKMTSDWTAEYNEQSKQVKVTFNPVVTAGKDDTFRISFNVKPNDNAYNHRADSGYESGVKGDPDTGEISAGKQGFHTNASASVSYCVVSTTTGSTNQEECKDSEYAKPVIPVTKATIRVVKKWVDASGDEIQAPEGMDSVDVTLKQGNEEYAEGLLTANGVDNNADTTDDNWSWSKDVAAGSGDKTYTVEETVPEGWTPTYTVTTAGGATATTDGNGVTFTGGKAGQFATITITNKPAYIAEYIPFEITKTLQGAPLERYKFEFHVQALDTASAEKAGFPQEESPDGVLTGCTDSQTDVDNVVDSCYFTNQHGSNQAGARAVAREANTLKFTAADANANNGQGSSFAYLYTEPKDETHNEDLPDSYVLDKHTYKAEVHVQWTDETKQTLTITTTVSESTDGENFTPMTGDGSQVSVTLPNSDDAEADRHAVVPFVNHYIAVSDLPLTGGTTGRQWLVTGLTFGGTALLLVGAMGVWRDRRRVL